MEKTFRGYMINGTAVIGYADSEEDFIASQSEYELTGIEEVEMIVENWIPVAQVMGAAYVSI